MRAFTHWNKVAAAVSAAVGMVIFSSMISFAAEKISSVTLTVDSQLMAGDDSDSISITAAESGHYYVTYYDITNDNGDWKVGDRPIVEVTLAAEDGYIFGSVKKSNVHLKGSKAEVSSGPSRKDGGETLELKIKLAKLDGTLELEDVEWSSGTSPVARWDDDSGAEKYQVRLYRDDSAVGDTVTVSQKKCNFAANITREGEYTFRVRAIGNNKKGEWYDSDSLYISEDDLPEIRRIAQNSVSSNSSSGSSSGSSSQSGSSTGRNRGNNGIITPGGTAGASGSWKQDGRGWWFRYPDGGYPKGGWTQIGSEWYCFDDAGYMRTGWIRAKNGDYYYCEERSGSSLGALLRDQRTPDGYWVNEKGIWVPGA